MRDILAFKRLITFLALIIVLSLSTLTSYSLTTIAQADSTKPDSHPQTEHSMDIAPHDQHTGQSSIESILGIQPARNGHADTYAIADTSTRTVPPQSTKVYPVHTQEIISPDVIMPSSKNGLAPILYTIDTKKPVVFLTIDDGIVKDPAAIAYMQQHHLVASLFLNDSKISDNYDYFKTLQAAGSVIENHTVHHLDLTKLSYAQQKKEICDNADAFATVFGKRPTLFRPPYGSFNSTTRKAAADCGMGAIIHWHAKANNGAVQYQQGNSLQAGDIVLMHFRKEVIADLTAFTTAAESAKLQPVLLEDWIK
jgi:peptidoglycan/xylan/chitin deacetylase (PgdA/CDA1 family)